VNGFMVGKDAEWSGIIRAARKNGKVRLRTASSQNHRNLRW